MTLAVFDASVVVKWYIATDPFFDAALQARDEYEAAAPTLMQAEVANALWKYIRAGVMNLEDACEGVAVLEDLIALSPDSELLGPALRLSGQLDHPVYDCVYLAMAQRRALPLITADRRLAEQARGLELAVKFIGSES